MRTTIVCPMSLGRSCLAPSPRVCIAHAPLAFLLASRGSEVSRRWASVTSPPPTGPSMARTAAVLAPPPTPSPRRTAATPKAEAPASPPAPADKEAKPPEADKPPKLNVRRFLEFVKPERQLYLGSLGLMGVASGVQLCIPKIVGVVTDLVSQGVPLLVMDNLPAFLGAFGLAVTGALASYGRWALTGRATARVVARMRERMFSALIRRPVSFYDATRSGEMVNRLSADTTVTGEALAQKLPGFLRHIVTLVGAFGMMLHLAPYLAALILGCVIPLGAMTRFVGNKIQKVSAEVQASLGKSGEVASEKLSNVRTVKAFANEWLEDANYAALVGKVRDLQVGFERIQGAYFATIQMGLYMMMGVLVASGGHFVQSGVLTVGQLTSFLMYSIYLAGSGIGLASSFATAKKGLGAAETIFRFIDEAEREAKENSTPLAPLGACKGGIKFDGIHFAFPTRPDLKIWKGGSLEVKAGEVVGIVGHSGSGKSTLAHLLLKQYKPQEGQVLVDGRDLQEVDTAEWLGQVGYVSQEPVLFAASIAENIGYGVPGASRERIERAAKLANAHEFIQGMSMGYDTLIGEHGATLSGGQKQRVAIARALLKNPRVLLLDEPTSALDSSSAEQMLNTLHHLVRRPVDGGDEEHPTILMITHHARALKHTERVVALRDGKVVASGPFEELSKDPEIASLFIE